MKRTQEILGLPVISVSDGNELGKVKSLIINADRGTVDYITVDSGMQFLNIRVISTTFILGVGEYAVTVESEDVISDINEDVSAVDLLKKDIQVKGTRVMTKKGRLIGEIGDIYVEEDDSFKIVGLEYIADITQKRIRLIPRDSVLTFGKSLVVVIDGVENTLLERPSQLSVAETLEAEKKNSVNYDLNKAVSYSEQSQYAVPFQSAVDVPQETQTAVMESIADHVEKVAAADGNAYFNEPEIPAPELSAVSEPVVEEEFTAVDMPSFQAEDIAETTTSTAVYDQPVVEAPVQETVQDNVIPEVETFTGTNAPAAEAVTETPASAASLFEQRQRQYLMGRKSTKTITDNNGNVIVEEGMVITGEVIDNAKQNGKLIELVMNNKA